MVAILLILALLRLAVAPLLPIRIVSVSMANLAGVAAFVATGVVFQEGHDPYLMTLIVVAAYAAVLVGEIVAHRRRSDASRWEAVSARLERNTVVRAGIVVVTLVYLAIPAWQVCRAREEFPSQFLRTWYEGSAGEYSRGVIERQYLQAERSGLSAGSAALKTQMAGMWLLAAGVVWSGSRPLGYFLLGLNAVFEILNSSGGRTTALLAVGLPLILVLTRFRTRTKMLCTGSVAVMAAVLVLGLLRHARSGELAGAPSLRQTLETLQADFAYGGLGLSLAEEAGLGNTTRAMSYLSRFLVMPIPRAIWPRKPVVDPNWEMTEAWGGGVLDQIGTVALFTPLGEALFYFGWAGLLLVPFAYGWLTSALESVFRNCRSAAVLNAHLLLWTFLCWRLTLWNLVGATLVANLGALAVLGFFRVMPPMRPTRTTTGARE